MKIDFGEKPISEIETRLGIGRTKSFHVLSAAMGTSGIGETDSFHGRDSIGDRDSCFTRLVAFPHLRFLALARKDWKKDTRFLSDLINGDPNAEAVVKERLGNSAVEKIEILATQRDVILAALTAKDWTSSNRDAAWLMGVNPHEARAILATEENQAHVKATKLLWDRYHPQYRVWIPFACVGLVAMIALAIFGQMAKRWKDMNA